MSWCRKESVIVSSEYVGVGVDCDLGCGHIGHTTLSLTQNFEIKLTSFPLVGTLGFRPPKTP